VVKYEGEMIQKDNMVLVHMTVETVLKSQSGKVGRHALYKKLKEAQEEETVARKNHDEIIALTKSPDFDPSNVSVLRQLDRASKELKVAQYRVKLIHGDLDMACGIRFGSGLHKAPMEEELQALEEQLERTLSTKQTVEDRLRALTAGRRTGSSGSDDRRALQHKSDSVNLTRASEIDTRSSAAGHESSHRRDITANTRYIQRV